MSEIATVESSTHGDTVAIERLRIKKAELEKDIAEARVLLEQLVQKINMMQGGLLTIDELLSHTNGAS